MAFILLTVGTFDFAMAVYASNFCTYSAREAARWAIVHGANSATSSNCSTNPGIAGGCAANSGDISTYVSGLAVGLDSSKLAVTTTWTPDTNPGAEVRVTVTYTIVPLTGLGLQQTLAMSSSSQMEMVH
jgi:Flp pilus assembly protein TadG